MSDTREIVHLPVLLQEVLAGLALQPNASVIDGTFGGGGHTRQILTQIAPGGRILALDKDPQAIERAQKEFSAEIEAGRLVVRQASFAQMQNVAAQQGFLACDAILLDLGVSSFQIDLASRGFSFLQDGPLDMRMDTTSGDQAADWVNTWDERSLADLIYQYGEEHQSRRIARAIVQRRQREPISTTKQLADLVEAAVGGRRGERIHPATRTFQALRIAVNHELEELETVLPQACRLLKPNGRLAVIAFHSLEDRIVKHWMQQEATDFVRDRFHPQGGEAKVPTLGIVTRKPIEASTDEINRNPRSRSAKLRIAQRI